MIQKSTDDPFVGICVILCRNLTALSLLLQNSILQPNTNPFTHKFEKGHRFRFSNFWSYLFFVILGCVSCWLITFPFNFCLVTWNGVDDPRNQFSSDDQSVSHELSTAFQFPLQSEEEMIRIILIRFYLSKSSSSFRRIFGCGIDLQTSCRAHNPNIFVPL